MNTSVQIAAELRGVVNPAVDLVAEHHPVVEGAAVVVLVVDSSDVNLEPNPGLLGKLRVPLVTLL